MLLERLLLAFQTLFLLGCCLLVVVVVLVAEDVEGAAAIPGIIIDAVNPFDNTEPS